MNKRTFSFFLILTFSGLFAVSCQNVPHSMRFPSSYDDQACYEGMRELLDAFRPSLLKSIDPDALTIEPAFFGSFVSYLRVSNNGTEVVVRRLSDGKVQFIKNVESEDVTKVSFDENKGRLFLVKGVGKKVRVKGFNLKPVTRKPVSYNEVLAIMKKDPYPVGRAPTIPLQMFRFFKKGLIDFFVGRRSKEILTQGADYRTIGLNKPIHPMGIGVEGKMVFNNSKYSGAFRGGEFPLLGRLSISQGNPSKYKERTWLQKVMGRPAKDETRSVAAAFKLFPTANRNEKVVTANALFQNDLNGEVLENYIDGVMTNQPQLNVLKIRQSYEIFTLLGVAKGALSNPNDLKKSFPYMNPQLRPLHQYAEMGIDDPSDVVTPAWIKIQAFDGQEVIKRDDFREELAETISQKGLRYQIFLADEVDKEGNILWEEAGYMEFSNTILSRGVDQNLLFFHDSLKSPFTGDTIDPGAVPIPKRVETSN